MKFLELIDESSDDPPNTPEDRPPSGESVAIQYKWVDVAQSLLPRRARIPNPLALRNGAALRRGMPGR